MEKIRPMLLEKSAQPFDNNEWLFELKFDGFRMVADARGTDGFLLYTRSLRCVSEEFSAIKKELDELFLSGIVFDGEVVLFDKSGKPNFYELLKKQKSAENIFYIVFDILYYEGKSVKNMPLEERKELLDRVFCRVKNKCKRVKKIEYFDNGVALFKTAQNADLEGIVAKKRSSVYLESIRSASWKKIKCRRKLTAYICGYTLKSRISLALGVPVENGKYQYIGNAGTGLKEAEFLLLRDKLERLRSDKQVLIGYDGGKPFFAVEPKICALIIYTEILSDGHLRNPVIERVID